MIDPDMERLLLLLIIIIIIIIIIIVVVIVVITIIILFFRPPARSLQAKNCKLCVVWTGTLPGTKITLLRTCF